MAGKRSRYTPALKAQIALAALQGDRTVRELAAHFGVRPTLVHAWTRRLVTGAEGIARNGALPRGAGPGRPSRPAARKRGRGA
jgi:transposase